MVYSKTICKRKIHDNIDANSPPKFTIDSTHSHSKFQQDIFL